MKYVRLNLALLISFLLPTVHFINAQFSWANNDIACVFSGTFKPEMFYGKNFTMLNNCNAGDQVWYQRHTLDLKLDVQYGAQTYGRNVAEFLFGVRNKAVWGNHKGNAQTTLSEFKVSQSVLGAHNHYIPRHLFWIREAWIDFELGEILGQPCLGSQHFTLGAFKFELGRGIALGAAYAVGPELLGFYNDSAIDQFAFGGKLSGRIIDKYLSYDLYAALLQNKSSSLADTSENIYGQEYGHREFPTRGFGNINYIIANRLIWLICDNKVLGKLTCEPYWLYNNDPEQKVEFLGDAYSELGTVGIASEYYAGKFECGFDYALNFGAQHVRGWDRNRIMVQNRDVDGVGGYLAEVNSHVVDGDENKILYVPNSETQQIIETSSQSEAWNGKFIADNIKNDIYRFRDPYKNRYKGWMVVADCGWWVYKKDLQVALTAGIASGGPNPNEISKDEDYSGFIGLQEIYSGKRVKSALVQEGGRIKRPLAAPLIKAVSKFPRNVSGFSNLKLVGSGLTWQPQGHIKAVLVRPNVLAYWLDHPVNKYDAAKQREINERASDFLGIEFNVFLDYYVLKNMKIFFVGAIFIPGKHYSDVKGKPLTAEQERILNRYNVTGFTQTRIPNLGDDPAGTFNLGVEFTF